jgi:hypothetical protein
LIRRESNTVADAIAKFARKYDVSSGMNPLPSHVRDLVTDDVNLAVTMEI